MFRVKRTAPDIHAPLGDGAPSRDGRLSAQGWFGPYTARRLLVLTLNLTTVSALIATMAVVLATDGWSVPEMGMLGAFAITLPWLSIGFWNALIGFAILKGARDPAGFVTPGLRAGDDQTRITLRTAIAMTVRNEDPSYAVARLRVMKEDLDAAGVGSLFEFHVLSDTSDPDIAEAEAAAVAAWKREEGDARGEWARIHYRRRAVNAGFKAGNIWEFVTRCADRYALFIPLDADSLMSAQAVMRLVRVMQANPQIGILQGLVSGMPSPSLFARVFQFGMRHGMRAYTTGSAWWQGDCGPFWGHNAVIRMRAFRDHCALPEIPGRHALAGPILSHDQVEAVLMRRAGYEVRVVAEEDESWEENPPSLPDFIKRDLRWCQGNMQYWWLLGLPGLKAMSRVQLALAILMYLGAPGWMLFLGLGAYEVVVERGHGFPFALGVTLFACVIGMSLMPKIMGVLDVLTSRRERQRYGGGPRVLASAFTELVFSALVAPVVSFAQARFILGLTVGRKMGWSSQRREGEPLRLTEAVRGFWLQMLFGAGFLAILIEGLPAAIPWATPLLTGFLGVVPFAMLSASPALGVAARRIGLCDIPEDRRDAPALAALTARLA